MRKEWNLEVIFFRAKSLQTQKSEDGSQMILQYSRIGRTREIQCLMRVDGEELEEKCQNKRIGYRLRCEETMKGKMKRIPR